MGTPPAVQRTCVLPLCTNRKQRLLFNPSRAFEILRGEKEGPRKVEALKILNFFGCPTRLPASGLKLRKRREIKLCPCAY